MGYVSGAFGIRGWINVIADTEFADSLLDYETWWLGRDGRWQAYAVQDSHVQPKKLAARLEGIDDRDSAFALKGMQVAVPRSAMPVLDSDDEFYWADLIGLKVVNTQGESLGVVDKLFETGANDVLVVLDGKTERLLPFVAHVVLKVDRDAGCITVDWGLDY
ncbi:16S rRNA processing protein RimM [Andreprevotia lacus DSM 23236]|jgi:16S rRNA processing protein RimM|uniref:Ribosome maturation factor RimM n=1 Tax=Andreprevotia lacus DSM 23236 TaxID=1121001 RepID=A0A1W1WWW9_9NEIS|nr:ribosome maturation factor RimM [Andreprevotia lacus]SMC15918.1 16S rRNA processing protein RimM [Andreprevotia lacus DSM 23236]